MRASPPQRGRHDLDDLPQRRGKSVPAPGLKRGRLKRGLKRGLVPAAARAYIGSGHPVVVRHALPAFD